MNKMQACEHTRTLAFTVRTPTHTYSPKRGLFIGLSFFKTPDAGD